MGNTIDKLMNKWINQENVGLFLLGYGRNNNSEVIKDRREGMKAGKKEGRKEGRNEVDKKWQEERQGSLQKYEW